MHHSDLLALFDREQRRDIVYPDMTREARQHVVRYTRSARCADLHRFDA